MTAQKIQPKSADPLRGEADLFAAGFELQHQGLELLLAEMRALAVLLPGDRKSVV